MLTGNTAVNIS